MQRGAFFMRYKPREKTTPDQPALIQVTGNVYR
jgi:hypothetical protein